MREQFYQQMNQLAETLVVEAKAAAKAMSGAAEALRDANLTKAEKVIDADRKIDLLERTVDEMGVSLLARQAPVASDLRIVVSALRLSATLERMGDLARHVAYIARGRYPDVAVPGDVHKLLVTMADHAAAVGKNVAELVETRDLSLAAQIVEEDDVLDDLHAKSFQIVLDDSQELTRQEIVDIVLLGRYLERYGDHAVSVARRMNFLVKGLGNDGSDPFAEVDLTEV
ncbi:phosphate signaling complex protein PhoU [Arcanobacterium bovis]|uniref:Phosphate-specific transport system accessory protein PhoU n=1 Tax=Arcanobacterium bovis TaxID=2529275 RepID=A0A4Q9V3Y9_9ACTO|nr:phosphate signaling complex protein PhoU [Arcanobacterium bovis]TBW23853.1 phosphate signaling complex protein PhoU [Arcanobacterium bovis]